jgi:ribosomal protein S18 acetylase RimI-like enzyme
MESVYFSKYNKSMEIRVRFINPKNISELFRSYKLFQKILKRDISKIYGSLTTNLIVKYYTLDKMAYLASKSPPRIVGTFDKKKNLVRGLLIYFPYKTGIWVEWICVLKTYRKKHIASKMMKFIEKHARNLGKSYLSCVTHPRNHPSCSLLQKLGYEIYKTDESNIYWRKNLQYP